MLSSEVWVMTDDASRSLLIACMLLASRNEANDGTFNGDPEYVRRVGYLNSKPDFKPLIQYGFIECLHDASTPLDGCNTEERREEKNRGEKEESISAEQVGEVFDFWKRILNHPRATLDSKRKRLIQTRLKDGYTVGDLCQAIAGCQKSAFHMGLNDKGAKYDSIDLILRDSAHVDQFIGYDKAPPTPMGKQGMVEAHNRNSVEQFVNGEPGLQ
jgi:hypothetical protein